MTVLYEDHIVDAVCAHLQAGGWHIESRAYATQTGDDVVAVSNDGERLRVEAKGEGSSVETSARFGKPFNYGQCQINVGQAALRSMRVVSGSQDTAGVAFPDTPDYRRTVEPVLAALRQLSIRVFMVGPDQQVLEL